MQQARTCPPIDKLLAFGGALQAHAPAAAPLSVCPRALLHLRSAGGQGLDWLLSYAMCCTVGQMGEVQPPAAWATRQQWGTGAGMQPQALDRHTGRLTFRRMGTALSQPTHESGMHSSCRSYLPAKSGL